MTVPTWTPAIFTGEPTINPSVVGKMTKNFAFWENSRESCPTAMIVTAMTSKPRMNMAPTATLLDLALAIATSLKKVT